MLTSEFNSIKISGISVATPTGKVKVESYNKIFGEDVVAKFTKMTGVKSVSRAVAQQTASDLGYEAATNLFSKLNIEKKDIHVLILCLKKQTLEYLQPLFTFIND